MGVQRFDAVGAVESCTGVEELCRVWGRDREQGNGIVGSEHSMSMDGRSMGGGKRLEYKTTLPRCEVRHVPRFPQYTIPGSGKC